MKVKHVLPAAIVGMTLFGGIALAAEAPTFDKADANKDGAISKTEAAKAVPKVDFAAADKNHDGTLSRAEYEAAVG